MCKEGQTDTGPDRSESAPLAMAHAADFHIQVVPATALAKLAARAEREREKKKMMRERERERREREEREREKERERERERERALLGNNVHSITGGAGCGPVTGTAC